MPETYDLIAVGERFVNVDGSSRQAELSQCRPGDVIALVRERDNPRDPMAVALYSERGVQLGYLNREHASWVGREMDAGSEVSARVSRVASKTRPGSPLALTIRLTIRAEGMEAGEPGQVDATAMAPARAQVDAREGSAS